MKTHQKRRARPVEKAKFYQNLFHKNDKNKTKIMQDFCHVGFADADWGRSIIPEDARR